MIGRIQTDHRLPSAMADEEIRPRQHGWAGAPDLSYGDPSDLIPATAQKQVR